MPIAFRGHARSQRPSASTIRATAAQVPVMPHAPLREGNRSPASSVAISITQKARFMGTTAFTRGSEAVARRAMPKIRPVARCRCGLLRSTRQDYRRGRSSIHGQIGRCSGAKAAPSSVYNKMGSCLRAAATSLGCRRSVAKKTTLAVLATNGAIAVAHRRLC